MTNNESILKTDGEQVGKKVIINEKPETSLATSDFFYELPPELIAQHPMQKRDGSRLMVIDRETGEISHKHFYDIIDYLDPNDVLVINDSKVIPARLYGHVEGREDAKIELLLLRSHSLDVWETLVKPGKRAKIGSRLVFGDGMLHGEIVGMADEGNRLIKFDYDRTKYQTVYEILHVIGLMPLPPYITETLKDNDRYQTVYAREEGSAAAPTAGLHFTQELLEKIKAKGVAVAPVMLHVGLGTFRPVKAEKISEHIMHTEYFSVPEESARIINERKAAGGRIICVGTTSCRTIESVADENGHIPAISGDTGIFIFPGYRFKAVDALITNFHLPESTLLMLISAFYGREEILSAYNVAVKDKYRFFSFGDAMLIV
ncbi:MAG: tRNA preQ1(34) S-adenosylmethionine ribosyltransferase-isomerase QueA [Clostridia bacterium]|nr:tRNA preQ1(34) S-adenosylmethionine ribosyltransferase-isomerase QueA [Clostridia bacterium]MEE1115752.1 tRNA preQ1(34) S-adenosylmethionine ribosyltransferase-isomerase QueA [Clostridia bacterium]